MGDLDYDKCHPANEEDREAVRRMMAQPVRKVYRLDCRSVTPEQAAEMLAKFRKRWGSR